MVALAWKPLMKMTTPSVCDREPLCVADSLDVGRFVTITPF
jgi:hypothetical protein